MSDEIIDGGAVLDAISARILDTRFEDIDTETVENTRTRIFDIIGCTLGGAPLPDIGALVRLVEDWGGKKEATIIGYGTRVPVQEAAFVNCTMSRGFDRGPLAYIFEGRTVPHHVSETTVMTALTLGESRHINGKELITALIMGDDLAARLHLANDRPLPGEMPKPGQEPRRMPRMGMMLPTETYGAAAIAGRLLGLDLRLMRNTLGLVGRPDGFGGGIWDGAPTFKIGQGAFARGGIVAALLARAGWTGAIDPFFGNTGFGQGDSTAGRYDHPELLVGDLGNKFYVEMLFKPYLGGGPTHAPIKAAITLVHKHNIRAGDIEEAILRTSPGVATGLHYARPYKVGDYPTGDALFSYKYAVASALARGAARNRDYTEKAVRDPVVQALIGRVTLALAELDKTEGIELEVRLKDGRSFSEYVDQGTGEPSRPLPRETLVDKFMEQVEFSGMVGMENAEAILKMVENLEEVDDVAEIVRLAVKS